MKEKRTYNDQSKEELTEQYKNLSKDIFGLKCELSVNRKIEKPHLLRTKKRERARILTALNQKNKPTSHK